MHTFCTVSASFCRHTIISSKQSTATRNGFHTTLLNASTESRPLVWPLAKVWRREVWAQFHRARQAFWSSLQWLPRWARTWKKVNLYSVYSCNNCFVIIFQEETMITWVNYVLWEQTITQWLKRTIAPFKQNSASPFPTAQRNIYWPSQQRTSCQLQERIIHN